MGGSNSGNHGGRRCTDTAYVLDLARLIRQGSFVPGEAVGGMLMWGGSDGAEPTASLGYEADLHHGDRGRVRLQYTSTRGGERYQTDLPIALTTTAQHFGGRRWWFLCPHTGERVGKLYLPPGSMEFASRKAHRLAYRSQRYSPADRRTERMHLLRRRLGNDGGMTSGIAKQPRMRWTTFDRRVEEILALEDAIAGDMTKFVERFRQRWPGTCPS